MTWQHDQMVRYGGGTVRIESGPWKAGSLGADQRYLVEMEDGVYRFVEEQHLFPLPLQRGQQVTHRELMGRRRIIHSVDDEVVVTKLAADNQIGPLWQADAVAEFEKTWTRWPRSEEG